MVYENFSYKVLIYGSVIAARHVEIVERDKNSSGFTKNKNKSCSGNDRNSSCISEKTVSNVSIEDNRREMIK